MVLRESEHEPCRTKDLPHQSPKLADLILLYRRAPRSDCIIRVTLRTVLGNALTRDAPTILAQDVLEKDGAYFMLLVQLPLSPYSVSGGYDILRS